MADTFTAYQGRAIIQFYPHRHYYLVSVPGVVERLYQPGVTTILGMKDKSRQLQQWAVRQMGQRVRELVATVEGPTVQKDILSILLSTAEDSYRDAKQEAADIGSLVHRVLEQALLGQFDESRLPLAADALLAPDLTPEMVEQANAAIRAGLRFLKKHDIEVVAAEQPRWSPTWAFIGTGDLVARVDGVLSILDFKTAKGIYPENFIQTAAYQVAYQEEFPEQQIQKRWIVRVGKDGKLMDETRDNTTLDDDFLCFRALAAVYRWNRQNDLYGKKQAPEPIRIIGNIDNLVPRPVEQKGAA